MKKLLLAVVLAAAGASPIGASAQPAAVAAPADAAAVKPSEAEALALAQAYAPTALRRQAELAILHKNFLPGMRRAPEVATMLDAFPELGPELVKALASQIDLYMAEYDERFFPRATAIIRDSLSKDDVRTLTAFYASPVGQKVLALTTDNVDGSELMERVAKNETIDTATMTRQALRAGMLTYKELSESERTKIVELSESPAGRNFMKLVPKLAALQTELMKDPGPRFKAKSEQAMAEAFKRVTGVDPRPTH